jgi:hypothetical protein
MKVYVFAGFEVNHDKVYASKEVAEKECKEYNEMKACGGSNVRAYVKEVEFVK